MSAELYVMGALRTLRVRPDALATEVADAALGSGCYSGAPMRGEGAVARVGGRWRLFVNARLPAPRRHWQIAYQTAAWLLAQDGASVPITAVAAILLLPTDVALRHLRGRDPHDLARVLVTPIVAAYLRDGEVRDTPTAHVVAGLYARVRGRAVHAMPRGVAHLEILASAAVTPLRIARWRSTDERGVILRAA